MGGGPGRRGMQARREDLWSTTASARELERPAAGPAAGPDSTAAGGVESDEVALERGAGMRRSEVSALRWADSHRPRRTVTGLLVTVRRGNPAWASTVSKGRSSCSVNRASCEKRVRLSFCLRPRGERGSADGTQRSQDDSDRHCGRGAGAAGVHGACLPVMRASTREEMRRISSTSRSSSRLFSIHSR